MESVVNSIRDLNDSFIAQVWFQWLILKQIIQIIKQMILIILLIWLKINVFKNKTEFYDLLNSVTIVGTVVTLTLTPTLSLKLQYIILTASAWN